MKKLLFAICAVATLASCSKDEVVSYDKGEAIGFSNPFVNKATRAVSAADPSYSTVPLTSFNVWGTANGVPIYTNEPVNVVDGVGTPTTTTNYWVKDVPYRFAALANASEVTLTSGLPTTVKNFTAPTTADKDLIYAKTDEIVGKESGNSNVPLTFTHLLSKVKFTVTNTPADNYFYKVTNIKVNGKTIGDVNITTTPATWAGKADSEDDYEVADIDITDDTNTAYCAQELLLIPGTFTISFTVNTYFGSIAAENLVKSQNYSHSNQVLATGTAYNFVISIAPGEIIKFAPSVTNWDDPSNLPM